MRLLDRYRWWTCWAGNLYGALWLKLGPVTFMVYTWSDGRIRVSVCAGQRERLLWGGPLGPQLQGDSPVGDTSDTSK